MKDEMDKDLGGAVADEEAAAKGFEELAAAKNAEISAASEAIESKTVRSGDLAVSVTTTADDIEDTTAEMRETMPQPTSDIPGRRGGPGERPAARLTVFSFGTLK